MSDGSQYRIKIRKGDFEVEVQGDREWVDAKIKEYNDIISSLITTSPHATTITSAPEKKAFKPGTVEDLPETLAQFYRDKGGPKSHNDKAIVFAYWLDKKEELTSYNFLDIEKCYDEMRMKKPVNTIDVMNQNHKKDYLIVVPDKDKRKAWRMSTKGMKYVEDMNSE